MKTLAPEVEPETGIQESCDYEAMWSRLQAKVPWIIAEAKRRQARAEALFAELMDLPAEKRHEALATPRFQVPDLLRLLLERGETDETDEITELAAQLAVSLLGTGAEDDVLNILLEACVP